MKYFLLNFLSTKKANREIIVGAHKLKLMIAVGIIFCALLCCGGCWDRDEPEDQAFVVATGIDYHPDQELYEIIVQVADPGALVAEGGSGETPSFAVFSAKGHTPFQAARDLALHSTREPFFAHSELFAISENTARHGLGPALDFFRRERQTRLTAVPLVLEGDTSITQLFRTDIPLENYSAEGMTRQAEQGIMRRAAFPSRSLADTLMCSNLPGRDMLIGRVTVEEQTKEDKIGEEGEALRGTIKMEGAAAFKEDELVGWFDQSQIKGWAWIHEKIEAATVNIKCPAHDKHNIGLEIYEAQSDMKPVITIDENGNRQYRIDLFIQADGRIQDQLCPTGYVWEGDLVNSLNQRLAQVIKNNIKDSFEHAQSLGTDVFGFGNCFYRNKYREWEKIEADWVEIFQNDLRLNIEVDATVRRAGLIQEPWR